jgi:hypothetical protein
MFRKWFGKEARPDVPPDDSTGSVEPPPSAKFPEEKVACSSCGKLILQRMAIRNEGRCFACTVPSAVNAEHRPPATTSAKAVIGICGGCERELKVKKSAEKTLMNLTCKCGWSGYVGYRQCTVCGKKLTAAEGSYPPLACPGTCDEQHSRKYKASVLSQARVSPPLMIFGWRTRPGWKGTTIRRFPLR